MSTAALVSVPAPVFDHLDRLTDEHGLFEHAEFDAPRPEHGYCVDDVARGLVVTTLEPDSAVARRLSAFYLDFVLAALTSDGRCRNRMDAGGRWHDDAGTEDCWGRALWALGVTAVHGHLPRHRERALAGFRSAARLRPMSTMSHVFAVLGAGELALVRPREQAARDLLTGLAGALGPVGSAPDWPWHEPRLRYGNGSVAHALIVAGHALGDDGLRDRGLALLDFLLTLETRDGHLSVTPVLGRGPAETGPAFDQQPIEVAALAGACAAAHRATGDPRYVAAIDTCWRWFLGDNDSATPMLDARTGAGYDGLQADGRNLNQGAESTLAMLATAQYARAHGPA